ncbi:MAG: UDP-N-acetylmuramoyl-L-alanyl-D-glutamate--2,6-diaminopimelate ligase [Elusimicrobia bacterium]|nr:UDP-N-acetylmuramoyl-L-alanyl-D-glutamate--2,6-diaminopimelate ligase [Elusimicrobiota bacterium]
MTKTIPLKELLGCVSPIALSGPTQAPIGGLTHDSRQVRPGDLFFALPGSKTDGNRHVKKACELGAVAVVSELKCPPAPVAFPGTWIQVASASAAMGRIADRWFGHPSGAMTVIGVTGTNGKTTTTYFLEAIIKACGGKAGVAGTIDYRLGDEAVTKAPNTTPISLELLRLLARFRDGGATHAAMEVSSHALALGRVDEIDFDAAVFTNLRRDHLDFHGTVEEYFQAKARLFELLNKAANTKKKRVAAINADDERSGALKRKAASAEVVLYGFGEGAALRAARVETGLEGARFDLVWRGRTLPAEIRLVGAHNISNALAAAAAALGLGLPAEKTLAGLKALSCVPGRLEPVEAGQEFKVFVDYAHTDSALETVLEYLEHLPHRRLITVIGCGGERDRTKRGPMGAAACRHSALAVITSDNPRGEDPLAIIKDIEDGLKTGGFKNYKIEPDRSAAIGLAVDAAGAGDIVLIAGKGHEDYQILKERTIPFDDREVARAQIQRRLSKTR